jgi:biotin carboxylase
VKDLLLIGAGVQGIPYIEAARRLGARIVLVETAQNAERLAGRVDEVYLSRSHLDEAWAEAASAAVAANRPTAVLGFTEWQVTAAALMQDQLGVPGPSLHAAVVSRNKALQRATFAAHGIRQPEFVVTEDLASVRDWALQRLPVVVKPLTSAGSFGVELVANADELRAVEQRRAGEGRLLVEAAVAGPEFSWEALVRDGQVLFSNVTAKETTGPPGFVETGHRAGHELPAGTGAAVERMARAVIAAMRVQTSLVHLEFKVGDAGPVLIEVAVRTPGGFIMDIVSLAHGIDLYEAVVRLALGLDLEVPAPTRPARRAASLFVLAEPGEVVEVSGLAEVQAHPAVVRAESNFAVGAVVPPLRSSAERAAFAILAAPGDEELDRAVEFCRGRLRVHTRPA